jgi:hypothetical protein
VEAVRRHRQDRRAGAFCLFARFGFNQGLAGHITARGEIEFGKGPLNRAAFDLLWQGPVEAARELRS